MENPFRMYAYDITTREEIAAYGWNGSGECGIRDGVRYMDTIMSADVFDFKTRKNVRITAESFPGRRVALKWWSPDAPAEWRVLVGAADGFEGNKACRRGPIGRATLGKNGAKKLGVY